MGKNRFFHWIGLFIIFGFSIQNNPQRVAFSTLMNLSFEEVYNSEKEKWEYLPEFPEEVIKLDKQEVYIKGYVIPVDLSGDLFALSAYPFSSCFFCGGAGPESVIGLKMESSSRYTTDQIVTFTGVLSISNKYESEFFYTLENAKEYKP